MTAFELSASANVTDVSFYWLTDIKRTARWRVTLRTTEIDVPDDSESLAKVEAQSVDD